MPISILTLATLKGAAEASMAIPDFVYQNTPEMDELSNLSPSCPYVPRSYEKAPEIEFQMTADDWVSKIWVDEVQVFNGQVKTNQNSGLMKVDLTGSQYNTHCTGNVCDHVLAVEVRDAGSVISAFIAIVKLNGKTYKSGVDFTWRGKVIRSNSDFNAEWNAIDFDDKSWPIAGYTYLNSNSGPVDPNKRHRGMSNPDCVTTNNNPKGKNDCCYGGWNIADGPKPMVDAGAQWIDAQECRDHRGYQKTRLFRFKFQTRTCSEQCVTDCLNVDFANALPNGCVLHTNMQCGIMSDICPEENLENQCASACEGCRQFWDTHERDILEEYYTNGEPIPDDWEGCFKWGVEWPCRNCKSPDHPNLPLPDKSSNCENVDNTPLCRKGWEPCGCGIPKCYPEESAASKDAYCEPIPGNQCTSCPSQSTATNPDGSGASNGGSSGNGSSGQSGSGAGNAAGGGASGGTNGSGQGSGAGNGGNGAGNGASNPSSNDADVSADGASPKNPIQVSTPPGFKKWPKAFPTTACPICAEAAFKCRAASCSDWPCDWWCRCYEANVEYECDDDGEPCACDSLSSNQLYNLTYNDLLNSGYMDIKFFGPGADELNQLAKDAGAYVDI